AVARFTEITAALAQAAPAAEPSPALGPRIMAAVAREPVPAGPGFGPEAASADPAVPGFGQEPASADSAGPGFGREAASADPGGPAEAPVNPGRPADPAPGAAEPGRAGPARVNPAHRRRGRLPAGRPGRPRRPLRVIAAGVAAAAALIAGGVT